MAITPWDIFGSDPEIEKSGAWIDYGDWKVKLASTGSEKYRRVMKAVFRPYERQVRTDTMPEDLAKQKLAEVFAKAIVLDWWCAEWGEGTMWGPDRERLDFNEKNVIKLLIAVPRMFDMVQDEAQRAENFRKQEEEAAVKNSQKSSSINSGPGGTKQKSSPPRESVA